MRGNDQGATQRRELMPSAARASGAVERMARGGELRALDRLSDPQLMAVEMMVLWGLSPERVAKRLAVDASVIRFWMRDSVFSAAANELLRSYCAGQLVPLALMRVRQLLCDPMLKVRDAVHCGRW